MPLVNYHNLRTEETALVHNSTATVVFIVDYVINAVT